MSVLGRVYLAVALAVFVIGVGWTLLILLENDLTVRVIVPLPRLDAANPWGRQPLDVGLPLLLAGWAMTLALGSSVAIRWPFAIRAEARRIRRRRELEREVLALRTLPLRLHASDDELAAEAHLDVRVRKVMTEQMTANLRDLEVDDAFGSDSDSPSTALSGTAGEPPGGGGDGRPADPSFSEGSLGADAPSSAHDVVQSPSPERGDSPRSTPAVPERKAARPDSTEAQSEDAELDPELGLERGSVR